ncbi:hypothetical protein OHPBIL_OHPBIL_11595, partial [Dysosmobacter welbionis]
SGPAAPPPAQSSPGAQPSSSPASARSSGADRQSGSGPPGLPGRPSFPALPPAAGQERRSGPASRRRSRQRGPPASSFSAPAGWAWERRNRRRNRFQRGCSRRSFASSAGSGHPAAGYSPAFPRS